MLVPLVTSSNAALSVTAHLILINFDNELSSEGIILRMCSLMMSKSQLVIYNLLITRQ